MRKLVLGSSAALLATFPLSATQPDDTLPSALEAGWEGEKVCALRHQSETHRVLRCTFPPGVGHEKHYHPAHYGFALTGGTMRLTDSRGTRTAELATGSDYSSEGTEWHEVVNVDETTVTYLIVEEL